MIPTVVFFLLLAVAPLPIQPVYLIARGAYALWGVLAGLL